MCGAPGPGAAGGSRRPQPGGGSCAILGSLQLRLRESETKRLELERKLFEYSKSDTYIAKINFIKLKKYLKEICERQKNAVLRNQEFLKEFDRVEAHIRTFTSSEALQKLKVQYEGEIKSMLSLQKNSMPIKGDKEDNNEQMLPVARQAGINTTTATSRGLYHPATIFMGRQMSAISSIEDFSTQQKSSQPTKSFSVSDPHSCRQAAQSSNMTGSYVVQTNSDIRCLNKSDKIDGKTYLQMGEKMPVTSSVSSENGRTHCLEIESNPHNGNSNLVESKKSVQLNSLLHERLSPENRITDLKSDCCSSSVEEMVTKEHFVANKERSKQPIPLVSAPEQLVSGNKQPRDNFPGLAQHTDSLWPSENTLELEDESLDSSSDLTVSVSEEDQIINTVELQQSLRDMDCKMALKSMNSEQEKETLSTKEHFSLQTVNCHTTDEHSSANSATRDFCNQTGNLKEEDLEACEAVVLHQLQGLLQNTLNGCLLPEKTLNDRGRSTDEKQVRPDLPLDFAMLWERLCKHILFLKKHHVLLKEEVKEMFGTLLISEKNAQDGQVTLLLREVLPEECGDRSSIHSNESSYRLPSILNDNGEIKQTKHAQWLDSIGTREQEVTSWCEDESKEESLAEKIPITGLNIGSNSFKTKEINKISSEASFSSSEGRSPLSRNTSKRRITTIKSKAFWGESDDSNSEIEAALRPQTHDTYADEFDDFYD
ncbi:centrosomal protein kizuna isoform X3 [Malaclemys terrapin pileata]|uniref:centrosomal protein kizuna isoform X3 n=1 Tax=Malaclemys terrapin pileata TaxID=2991368 RepID=UPI0023A87D20|nr:centrosomal protein kizuna isoform X3 [Malaclemys terrapin pileata]